MTQFSQRVYITRKIPSIAKELLSKHFYVEENAGSSGLSKEKLKEAAQRFDGLLTTFVDRIDAEVLQNAKIKAISNYAIGLDNIDLALARKLGIAVYNTPDIVTNSTADLTFALLLSFIRQIPQARDYVKKGLWQQFDPLLFLGEELHGKIFGILGYGRIGKAVAQRALGFGLKVIVYHRSEVTHSGPQKNFEQVSFDELLKRSDYLSLHVPLTPETHNMINLETMAKMARKPILINMARGAIVNPDDLVTALTKGMLRGAVLDVTSPEPIPHEHPLCHMENCLIIPHLGTATIECREAMAVQAAQNLIEHFKK